MIIIGDRLPDVTFSVFTKGGLSSLTTHEVFAGKRVLLVGIPGAFTPVCSGNHLPGYVGTADAFRGVGVDEIVCVSVNDSFVMNAFGEAQQATGKVAMLPDSNAEFTRKIGMAVDASGFGLGVRSQRYAMVVKDGVVETVQAEDDFTGLGVTSAEHMLLHLSAQMAPA